MITSASVKAIIKIGAYQTKFIKTIKWKKEWKEKNKKKRKLHATKLVSLVTLILKLIVKLSENVKLFNR